RRGSCGGGARGWRSSLLMLRLRGRGCRHRSRNDKNCRDACVPLEHGTTLLHRPQVNARNGVRVSLAKGTRLTWGLQRAVSGTSEGGSLGFAMLGVKLEGGYAARERR